MSTSDRLKQVQEIAATEAPVDLHKVAYRLFIKQRRFIRMKDLQREALEKIQRKILERPGDERE